MRKQYIVPVQRERTNVSFPSIFLCNPRSLNNKLDELSVLLHEYDTDLCAISETWFTPEQPESSYYINGYEVFAKCRPNRKGGGVAVYVKPFLNATRVDFLTNPDNFEVMWVKLSPHRLPRSVSVIFVAAVYSPPSDNQDESLIHYLTQCIDTIQTRHLHAGIILLGDFNRVNTSPLCQGNALIQVVNKPTRVDVILDKIFSNLSVYYKVPQILSPVGHTGDHNCVTWVPKQYKPQCKTSHKRTIRPMKDSDMRDFGQWITQHKWPEMTEASNTQGMYNAFYDTLSFNLNKYFPLKTIKLHKNDRPWLTPQLKSLIRKRQSAFHNGLVHEWKSLRNKIQREICHLKTSYYRDRVQNLKHQNPSSWYKSLKVMTGSANNNPMVINVPDVSKDDYAEIAKAVNETFAKVSEDIPKLEVAELPSFLPSPTPPPVIQPWAVCRELQRIKPGKSSGPDGLPARLLREFAPELAEPLSAILNSSYKDGSPPVQWKRAIITPIPKAGNNTTPDNVRPIALTDHFSKIAELFISKLLLEDISPNLDPKQFGSRPDFATTHYLIELIHYLAKNAEKPSNVSTVVCSDFSKAFDRVQHTITIKKAHKPWRKILNYPLDLQFPNRQGDLRPLPGDPFSLATSARRCTTGYTSGPSTLPSAYRRRDA